MQLHGTITPLAVAKSARTEQEAVSPVEKVASLGKDTVLGDPQAQRRTKHHHCRQQKVEMPPECGVTQELGCQVRQDHQHCVEKHLNPQPTTLTGS